MRRTAAAFVTILMALVLMAGPVSVAFHHHEDHQHHSDCKVCQLETTLSSMDPSAGPPVEFEEVCFLLEVPSAAEAIPSSASQCPRPRSPPQLLMTAA